MSHLAHPLIALPCRSSPPPPPPPLMNTDVLLLVFLFSCHYEIIRLVPPFQIDAKPFSMSPTPPSLGDHVHLIQQFHLLLFPRIATFWPPKDVLFISFLFLTPLALSSELAPVAPPNFPLSYPQTFFFFCRRPYPRASANLFSPRPQCPYPVPTQLPFSLFVPPFADRKTPSPSLALLFLKDLLSRSIPLSTQFIFPSLFQCVSAHTTEWSPLRLPAPPSIRVHVAEFLRAEIIMTGFCCLHANFFSPMSRHISFFMGFSCCRAANLLWIDIPLPQVSP